MRSVKNALEGIAGISDIELDGSKTCGSFTAPKDLDVKATLDKLVEGGNNHVKGWSLAEAE